MKLIIDIDDEQVLFDIKNRGLEAETETDKVIINALYNGILLDDVKEEIEQDMSFDMFDDYGNKTRIHKELWEILDSIGKESEEE